MRRMSNPVMNYIILSQGMGIPVGKLALYTVFGGVRPSACVPITIDVGTNNEQLLKDKFYIGLRQKRATGEEYYNFLEEFMKYEDFANHDAFELLVKYGTTHLVFNDDIQVCCFSFGLIPLMLQGTAVVVLAGLVASLKLLGWSLVEHTFLFFGAGEAGTGIAEIIALAISKKGYHGDTSKTFFCGDVSESIKRLVKVTEECLHYGSAVCRDGALYRKIGKRISEHAEKFGYGVVDRFVGHGIGTVFHSEPLIFHHPR
ncbi:NADP-dependent malic enzyme-like isoform X2 [Solanum tuberosum]|uniref:NADP-dependent malic enzyme-like isoform X2 n=1 Tax=Solanum tuberosum TaxID=4113 RepID=UPI00073A4437|nr:PREDICTED: NADP-dependent malic enzyme-like isoform X2 [Solanum tuberosum]